jgi:hypothetical protein
LAVGIYLEVHNDMANLEANQAGHNCHQGTANCKDIV